MPQIILGPQPKKSLDGSVKKAVFSFLEKLQADDTAPGLHIEPINGSHDPRVRTGRVSEFWRAVLVKVQGGGDAHYVYLGTFAHDDAIAFAKTASVRINPRNGIAELIQADLESRPEPSLPEATDTTPPQPPTVPAPEPLLPRRGVSLADLLELGIDPALAERAAGVAAGTETEAEDLLLDLAGQAEAAWQGNALVDLAVGTPLADVAAKLALPAEGPADPAASSDDSLLLEALQQPAARLDFHFFENNEELRAAIEDDDFGKWRVFLHPEQRDHATKARNGSFRLSGGAGTGKTVVLVHRARHLARRDPSARIILTTYNRTLAGQLVEQLRTLDPELPVHENLGAPGVFVGGIDQIARKVLQRGTARLLAGGDSPGSVATVLGARTAEVLGNTANARWDQAIAMVPGLPAELRSPTFFQAEYATVVLPNLVTQRDQYLRVRRPGRGTALSRPLRTAVWDVIEAYRASAAADATTDFEEKAMIAAVDLDAAAGAVVRSAPRPADHVLVDEGQDLTPARLLLLRALAEEGPDDLFLAEDSQQRIYGQKIVLSRYGINIRGRSRRLTLNYRTTAQNLRYAVGVLANEQFVDLDDESATVAGYRSARSGPPVIAEGLGSLAGEYKEAAELVRSWIESPERPTKPENIGLLVRDRSSGNRLVTGLAEHGVDARFVGSEMPAAPGKPVVMTMHRSKGMEFSKVVLFDISESSDPSWISSLPEAERADARLRDRSLIYVAATRARDELAILWKGSPSQVLPATTP
ncbi:UvrD-helicase domain-containing protein [Myceligenerans xiligouense]|uniref:DNA 3'-5' helicase n=1 Tax=Myceligenerans xiligouense TaxID=253184 RepID=A0A3N4YJR0_9MICO|nr:UvrD-helicase domain-containing protein [Myceligenerans xiligouense]RPF20983.1 UvrD-like helicase family protein [Myceligenerans xiligouense]